MLLMLAEALMASMLGAYVGMIDGKPAVAQSLLCLCPWSQVTLGWHGNCTHSSLTEAIRSSIDSATAAQRRKETNSRQKAEAYAQMSPEKKAESTNPNSLD